VDVLVQLHYLKQVLLEISELVFVGTQDIVLLLHDCLQLSHALTVVPHPSVVLLLWHLWLVFLVCSGLPLLLLAPHLGDGLPEVFVFVKDVLKWALRLAGRVALREVAVRILGVNYPTIRA
jgi:hypothetical protein